MTRACAIQLGAGMTDTDEMYTYIDGTGTWLGECNVNLLLTLQVALNQCSYKMSKGEICSGIVPVACDSSKCTSWGNDCYLSVGEPQTCADDYQPTEVSGTEYTCCPPDFRLHESFSGFAVCTDSEYNDEGDGAEPGA